MRNDRERAVYLRQEGKSYREIGEALRIPKATLSGWFKNHDWSEKVKQQLVREAAAESRVRMADLNRMRGAQLRQQYQDARDEAVREFEALKYHPGFIAGVMLYWGEGAKSSKSKLQLANTDPEMMRFFTYFLRKICGIPESSITAHVLRYPDLDEKLCRAYWAKQTDISWDRFTKSVLLKERTQQRRLTWGICVISVSSTYLKEKMLVWLKLAPRELMKREYYANIDSNRESEA